MTNVKTLVFVFYSEKQLLLNILGILVNPKLFCQVCMLHKKYAQFPVMCIDNQTTYKIKNCVGT